MKEQHPIPFDRMEEMYLRHLGDDDRPSCYMAYCRAESAIIAQTGRRKFKSYQTFRTTLWRNRSRRKKQALCTR